MNKKETIAIELAKKVCDLLNDEKYKELNTREGEDRSSVLFNVELLKFCKKNSMLTKTVNIIASKEPSEIKFHITRREYTSSVKYI